MFHSTAYEVLKLDKELAVGLFEAPVAVKSRLIVEVQVVRHSDIKFGKGIGLVIEQGIDLQLLAKRVILHNEPRKEVSGKVVIPIEPVYIPAEIVLAAIHGRECGVVIAEIHL